MKQIVQEVNEASRQQSQGIDQIAVALQQMERVTQSTAAVAEESAAASEELTAQAETTLGIVRSLAVRVGVQGTVPAQRPSAVRAPVLRQVAGRSASRGHVTRAEEFIPFDDAASQ
jgi:hypothetical protein